MEWLRYTKPRKGRRPAHAIVWRGTGRQGGVISITACGMGWEADRLEPAPGVRHCAECEEALRQQTGGLTCSRASAS